MCGDEKQYIICDVACDIATAENYFMSNKEMLCNFDSILDIHQSIICQFLLWATSPKFSPSKILYRIHHIQPVRSDIQSNIESLIP